MLHGTLLYVSSCISAHILEQPRGDAFRLSLCMLEMPTVACVQHQSILTSVGTHTCNWARGHEPDKAQATTYANCQLSSCIWPMRTHLTPVRKTASGAQSRDCSSAIGKRSYMSTALRTYPPADKVSRVTCRCGPRRNSHDGMCNMYL